MRVVESFLLGKRGDSSLCEDAIVVTDHFLAVIDGTTDRTGWTHEGKLGGRIAAERISAAIAQLTPSLDARTAIEFLAGSLDEFADVDASNRPSAAIAMVSRAKQELWRVGDVGFGVDGRVSAEVKEIDVALGDARAAMLQTHLNEGASIADLLAHDPGAETIRGLLRRQHLLRNVTGPFGYGAIDGSTVLDEHLAVVNLDGASEVILASDGYPAIHSTLQESEDELARLLSIDPLCIGPLRGPKPVAPGALSFDDRAYLRIALV